MEVSNSKYHNVVAIFSKVKHLRLSTRILFSARYSSCTTPRASIFKSNNPFDYDQ